MIKLKNITITVSGAELEITPYDQIFYNKERIGLLSVAFQGRKGKIINGIELFKLPENSDLAEEFRSKGWKETKGWSNFCKKLTDEQNSLIETEWLRTVREFDSLLLEGKIKMYIKCPPEQTNIFFEVDNVLDYENVHEKERILWDLKYYWEEKYSFTSFYKYTDEIKKELIEKRIVDITSWSLEQIKKQDEEERKEKESIQEILEKEQKEVEAAIEEELLVYGTEILSCNTNLLLHSLAIQCNEKTINLYTTFYAQDIPGANTSYSIKEVLKKEGFKFSGEKKEWYLPYSEENLQKAIEILKKYDTKADPAKLGMGRCWECGCYRKRLDAYGYCGC